MKMQSGENTQPAQQPSGDANAGGKRAGERDKGPKCIALVGPLASGKTALLEAILARTGAVSQAAKSGSGHTIGDHSAQARAHEMSVETTIATTAFMGEEMTFIDCPGSVEFDLNAWPVLAGADLAVVVAEPDPKKIHALQRVMHRLETLGIPRVVFLNKIDGTETGMRAALKILQPASAAPLLLRQIPLRKNGIIVGSIDLALERAYIYREHATSQVAPIPDDEKAREIEARFSMLETLADHDDKLMEQLLEEVEPPRDAIFDDLTADLRAGAVIPVLSGSAQHGNGILRLLKTIRHDAPGATQTARRLGLEEGGTAQARILKTIHTPHGGKLSVGRIFGAPLADGTELTDGRQTRKISGLYTLCGHRQTKISQALPGQTVALGKLDEVKTGDTLTADKALAQKGDAGARDPLPAAVYAVALRPHQRKDEAKLSLALAKLTEEDPSLTVEQRQDSGETVLSGHGEMHLRITRERLEEKYQIAVDTTPPRLPYRETIRKPVIRRGRHKKQSGGHGQFGDVVLEIKPLPRGTGFVFTDTIAGGVVPKQYIPSVEAGVREALKRGPLGFPVVDLTVNLADGSHHPVDSSDMAFQLAGRQAMREALAEAAPVLLEPILKVKIHTPSDAMARITAIITQHRGQILGFDARPNWPGWDVVEGLMPQAETPNLIIELRSATAGVAGYSARFDHMAELTGRLADNAMSAEGKAA